MLRPPSVARQYSGTLGKTANCQVAVSVHLAGERASCAADWRLFCPESWDDQALADPVAAAGARRRRARAGIPGEVRHKEKWRLALDMIEEMTGPGGWGVLAEITAAGGARPVVAADIAYGDNTLFRQALTDHSEAFAKYAAEARTSGGGIHHRFAVGDDYVLVVDEWESVEHFQKFFANPDLQALIAQAGAAPEPPEITIGEAISSPDEY